MLQMKCSFSVGDLGAVEESEFNEKTSELIQFSEVKLMMDSKVEQWRSFYCSISVVGRSDILRSDSVA
jgi:hypothetical protein